MARCIVALVAIVLAGGATCLGAQQKDSVADSVEGHLDSVRVARGHFWVRPVASLIIPGAGQFLAHQTRAAAYVAAEVYTLLRYFQLTNQAHSAAAQFRQLAFDVARRAYPRTTRDTVFEYYETMQRYTQSGEFDRGSGGSFIPESDPNTYNGSVWLTARRTYWPNPNSPPPVGSSQYLKAVQFYSTHAVGPGYLWSWQGAEGDLLVFRATIEKSDNAFRDAQDKLGLLLANHVASAVDALISSRLSRATRRPASIHTTLGRRNVALQLSFGF
jgi:hypothetical protein